MLAMPRPRKPYLHREESRHGRPTWYVRRGKSKRIRLRAEYGTPEFQTEYDAAIAERAPAKPISVSSKSLQWLYDRYRETGAWLDLSKATRRQRENIFVGVMAAGGQEPFAGVRKKDIEASKERRHNTPAQARNFLDAMRGLFRWAEEKKHIAVDPTAGVDNPKRMQSEGFKAWSEEDVATYERRWAAGTRERVWLHVLLYIGCRRGDAVTLGRQHVKAGAISFITEKSRSKTPIEVTRVIEPELAVTIAQGPCGDMVFISSEYGRPFVKESFGNAFKRACVDAGILDKSAHGVRKLAATLWAERGATEHELMAMFGWMTPQMAALYTRKAHRKRLALNAHRRLSEQPIPAPLEKVRAAGENE